MDRRGALYLLVGCAALALFATAASAQGGAAAGRGERIRIAYRNTPVASVVSDLARATGVSLIYDEKVGELGTVTIEGPPDVSRAEALAMIDSLLLLRGFAAVPGPGGVRKIIPISGSPSAWTASANLPNSDAPVTTLLRLQHANATDLVPLLAPYIGTNATASAFESTNSLILSGAASLLRTLRTAIEALDQPEAGGPLIWPMRIAPADQVAEQLAEIAGDLEVPYVTSDMRLNALLLRVRPGDTERIRELVDQLDRPAAGAAGIQVVRLRNADPEELASQLTALRSDAGGTDAAGAARRAGLRGLAFEVVADVPTNSLVLRGAPEAIDAVLDVVAELDRVPTSVRVEVTVAAFDVDDQLHLGIDYLIPSLADTKGPRDLIAAVFVNPSGGGLGAVDPAPSVDIPFVASFTTKPLLIPIIVAGTPITLTIPEGGSIKANGRTVKSDILMKPNLLITSGHEHEIFSGDNIPIPVARPEGGTGIGTGVTTGTGTTETGTSPTAVTGTAATGLGNAAPDDGTGGTGTGTGTGTGVTSSPSLTVQQNIERKDVGTSLRVTPTAGAQGGVILELRVEVSSVAESLAGPVERVGPTIRQTTVEATIRLQGGEVAVIATAAQPKIERRTTGVPWLMDIPVLGWAFRTTNDQTVNHHLLVAARAEILRPESHELADRLARELAPATAAARE